MSAPAPMTQLDFITKTASLWDEASAAGVSWQDMVKWTFTWLGTQCGVALLRGCERPVVHNMIEASSVLMVTQADAVVANPESKRILGL